MRVCWIAWRLETDFDTALGGLAEEGGTTGFSLIIDEQGEGLVEIGVDAKSKQGIVVTLKAPPGEPANWLVMAVAGARNSCCQNALACGVTITEPALKL